MPAEWSELLQVGSSYGVFGFLFIWILKKYFEKMDTKEVEYQTALKNNEKEMESINKKLKDIEKKIELNNVYNMKSFNTLKDDIQNVTNEVIRHEHR